MKKDPTYLIYLYLFIVIVLTGLLSCASSLSLSLSLNFAHCFCASLSCDYDIYGFSSSVEIYIHYVIHGPILSKIYKYPVLRFLNVFFCFKRVKAYYLIFSSVFSQPLSLLLLLHIYQCSYFSGAPSGTLDAKKTAVISSQLKFSLINQALISSLGRPSISTFILIYVFVKC